MWNLREGLAELCEATGQQFRADLLRETEWLMTTQRTHVDEHVRCLQRSREHRAQRMVDVQTSKEFV